MHKTISFTSDVDENIVLTCVSAGVSGKSSEVLTARRSSG